MSRPMVSAPPGRSSTTTCWPSSGDNSAASNLAMLSVALPAACGTTKRIGWSGNSAAARSVVTQRKVSAIKACRRMAVVPGLAGDKRGLFLARRAIEGRAAVLHDALDLALAAWAGLALAVIDLEIVLEVAERAVGAAVVAQARTPGLDGVDQGNGARGRLAAAVGDGRGRAFRRQPCPKQCLADIDVAEAGDDALIEQ